MLCNDMQDLDKAYKKINISFLRTNKHMLFRENQTYIELKIPSHIYSSLIICSFMPKTDLVLVSILQGILTMVVERSDVQVQGSGSGSDVQLRKIKDELPKHFFFSSFIFNLRRIIIFKPSCLDTQNYKGNLVIKGFQYITFLNHKPKRGRFL